MKLKSAVLSFLLFALVSACSSHDDYGLAIPKETAINYLPLSIGNQWSYNSRIDLGELHQSDTTETLAVIGINNDNDTPGYFFASSVTDSTQGVTAALWSHGMLNKVEGRIIFNGDFFFRIPLLNDTLSIPVHNLIYLDQNADLGETLAAFSGTLNGNITLDSVSFPIRYHYQLSAVEDQNYTSYSNGLHDYTDLISANLSLQLSATITLADGTSLNLLSQQPVLQTTAIYAKEIGLVHSISTFRLNFENLSTYELPQLPAIHGTAEEVLENYTLITQP